MGDTAIRTRHGLLRLGRCFGARIENDKGEPLGRFEDVLVDLTDGHITAFILSFREFSGLGDKLVPVPIVALSVEDGGKRFVLNVDRETLHQAPSFKADQWPELIDRVWATELYAYYGFPPYRL